MSFAWGAQWGAAAGREWWVHILCIDAPHYRSLLLRVRGGMAAECSGSVPQQSRCYKVLSVLHRCFTVLHRWRIHTAAQNTSTPFNRRHPIPRTVPQKTTIGSKIFFLSRMYSSHIWCAVKKNCCWQQLVKNVHTSLLSVRCRVTQDLEGYSADLPQTVKVSSNVHFGLNFEFWIPCFQPGLSLDSWKNISSSLRWYE